MALPNGNKKFEIDDMEGLLQNINGQAYRPTDFITVSRGSPASLYAGETAKAKLQSAKGKGPWNTDVVSVYFKVDAEQCRQTVRNTKITNISLSLDLIVIYC